MSMSKLRSGASVETASPAGERPLQRQRARRQACLIDAMPQTQHVNRLHWHIRRTQRGLGIARAPCGDAACKGSVEHAAAAQLTNDFAHIESTPDAMQIPRPARRSLEGPAM